MTMTKADPEREERRRQQKEIADSLKESGALDEIFARIDAGEPLTGHAGLLKGMLKASLERGLDAELTDHVGYDRGDPDAALFPNSRNGTFPKTVASEIGDVELAIPRDRARDVHADAGPQGRPSSRRARRDDRVAVRGRDDDPRHRSSSRLDDRHRAVATRRSPRSSTPSPTRSWPGSNVRSRRCIR